MNRDDISRWARETGAYEPTNEDDWAFELVDLERFANLVAAAEREACAKLCESAIQQCIDEYNDACQDCANAIRARSVNNGTR
jgi:hypothetical protein